MDEESQVHHHGQGEQQHLDIHARPDEHDHSQHGQQTAVQVVLGTDGRVWARAENDLRGLPRGNKVLEQ